MEGNRPILNPMANMERDVAFVVRAFAHGALGHRIDPSWFQPVLHEWCNKGRGMCYSLCEMMHREKNLAVNQKE